MAIQERERMYEVVVRWNIDPAGAEAVSAHQCRIVEFFDDETGSVRSATAGDAVNLAVEDVGAVVGEVVPTLLSQKAQVEAAAAAAAQSAATALAAMTDERDAANTVRDSLQAQLDVKSAQLETALAQIAELTAPPAIVRVSRMQARLALKRAGLLDAVETAVAQVAAADPTSELPEYWNGASYFHRTHPMIAAVGAVLGLSEQQIDALFAVALTIE